MSCYVHMIRIKAYYKIDDDLSDTDFMASSTTATFVNK